MPVWALPVPLAATPGIILIFSSSGYLDVSVHRVPLHALWIHAWIRGVFPRGFPHSDIHGSLDICSSPWLFAAYHVFLRLLVPRHPPCALIRLTCFPTSVSQFPYLPIRLFSCFFFFLLLYCFYCFLYFFFLLVFSDVLTLTFLSVFVNSFVQYSVFKVLSQASGIPFPSSMPSV